MLWLISTVPPTRKYNEKQSHHKIKLRQAKQVFLRATAQRDHIIQKLENDLALATSLSHKVAHTRRRKRIIPQEMIVPGKISVCFCIFLSHVSSSGGFQEKERIHTVTEENEKLLEEKRDLLRKISEAEEMGSIGMRTASTVQHRYLNESN